MSDRIESGDSAHTEARESWAARTTGGRRSAIDEILATREPSESSSAVSRYGEGDGKRRQKERDDVRETYLAMDIRLKSGEYRGLFYFDLAGGPRLDPHHTTLTVPFRTEKLVIRGFRLLEVYRAILHHSVDILEETPHSEFDASGDEPVISSIEVVEQGEEQ